MDRDSIKGCFDKKNIVDSERDKHFRKNQTDL